MAVARSKLNLTSTTKAEAVPSGPKQLPPGEKSVQPAADEPSRGTESIDVTTSTKSELAPIGVLPLTPPSATLDPQARISKTLDLIDLDQETTPKAFRTRAVVQASLVDPQVLTPLAEPVPGPLRNTELHSEFARVLSKYGRNISQELLSQLESFQTKLVAQAMPGTPRSAEAIATLATPKIVVKIPQPVTAAGVSTTVQTPATESPVAPHAEASSQRLVLSQQVAPHPTPSKASVPSRAPEPNEKVAHEARLGQSPVSRPTTFPRIVDTVHTRANIFGEHIVKTRFRSRTSSVASSIDSTADSLSSISAGFSQLTLREQIQASPSTEVPAGAVYAEAAVPNSSQALSTMSAEAVQQGAVQSLLSVRETPSLVDSAVARQYDRQSVSGSLQYASANPFVQPVPKEISRASSRATSMETPFVQPVVGEKPRASSRSTSIEYQSASPWDLSRSSQRYPTTPYNRNEAPGRLPSRVAPKPPLPAFLQGLQPNKDPAGAARAQYGGTVKHHSHERDLAQDSDGQVHSPAPAATRGPPLPTTSQTPVNDPAKYRNSQMKQENEPLTKVKDPWQRARDRSV